MVFVAELASDLTGGVEAAVHIDVGLALVQRRQQLLELTGGDALGDGADHIGRSNDSFDAGRSGRACLGPCGAVAEVAAEEDADAAALRLAPEVDVRLQNVTARSPVVDTVARSLRAVSEGPDNLAARWS